MNDMDGVLNAVFYNSLKISVLEIGGWAFLEAAEKGGQIITL